MKILFTRLVCLSLLLLCFVGVNYSQTAEFKVVISTVDGSDGNERLTIAEMSTIDERVISKNKFKYGELIKLKVEITNLSDKDVAVPKDGIGFNRPTLIYNKSGKTIHYYEDISKSFEKGTGGSLSGVFSLKPNETKSEVILLSDFYDKLKAGKYTLSIERRFWKSPNVTSNTITFEIVRSKNQKQWFKSGNAY